MTTIATNSLELYANKLAPQFKNIIRRLARNLPIFHVSPSNIILCLKPVELWANDLEIPQQISLVVMLAALQAANQNGSTCLPLSQMKYYFERLLTSGDDDQIEGSISCKSLLEVARQLLKEKQPESFFSQQGDNQDSLLVITEKALYKSRHYSAEQDLKTSLNDILQTTNNVKDNDIKNWLEPIKAHPSLLNNGVPMQLSAEQERGIAMIFQHRMAILAGGAGSGKTAVIASILRVIANKNEQSIGKIFLAAPTGKAANRIKESVESKLRTINNPLPSDLKLLQNLPTATTLHRLLGYKPELGFTKGSNDPLTATLVIVDEASMIDLFMMRQLISALGPKCSLLLVGDPNQLPPIGCASVLRDLYEKWFNEPFVTTLTSSYRMAAEDQGGAAIATTASALLSGHTDLSPKTSFFELLGSGLEFLSSSTVCEGDLHKYWKLSLQKRHYDLKTELDYIYKFSITGFSLDDNARLRNIFNTLTSSIILSTTNEGQYGVSSVNQRIHYFYKEITGYQGDIVFGEPVICTSNDYFHNIFNGDLGFVANVQSGELPPCPMVIFPRDDKFTAIPLESLLDHIQLAHALTVHKSQGSEVSELLLLLPNNDSGMCSKELLYTAITRAKHHVVIYGDLEVWNKGCKRKLERYSGLKD